MKLMKQKTQNAPNHSGKSNRMKTSLEPNPMVRSEHPITALIKNITGTKPCQFHAITQCQLNS